PSRPAPAFTLPTAGGEQVSLADYRGKAVFVHFWATWCPPCVHEIPDFLEFARTQRGKPVHFIAISLDDAWPTALKILAEKSLPPNVSSVLDVESKVPDSFGSFQFPETYLISADQRIIGKYVGAQDWQSHPIQAALEHALPSEN